MAMKWFLLFLFAVCTADTAKKHEKGWKPPCESVEAFCYMDSDPVCGTDGKTYDTLCDFCTQNMGQEDALIAKPGPC